MKSSLQNSLSASRDLKLRPPKYEARVQLQHRDGATCSSRQNYSSVSELKSFAELRNFAIQLPCMPYYCIVRCKEMLKQCRFLLRHTKFTTDAYLNVYVDNILRIPSTSFCSNESCRQFHADTAKVVPRIAT